MTDLMMACSEYKSLTGDPTGISVNDVMKVLHKNPRGLQRALMQKVNTQRADVFKGGIHTTIDRARYLSSLDHYGNAYLRALPSDQSLTIKPGQLAEALLHRLGLPSAQADHIAGHKCKCKLATVIDPEGYHLRSFPLGVGAQVEMHNECVSLVADLARDCSFYVRVEPRRVFQTTHDRPDLLISHYHPRSLRPTAVDLTFHSSTTPSNRGSAAIATGHLSLLRERLKSKKYAWQTDILNYFFMGCGMEDGGAMLQRADRTLV